MMKLVIAVILAIAITVNADEADDLTPKCQKAYEAVEAEIQEYKDNNYGSSPVDVVFPECLEDGNYAPRQCDDDTCKCVAPDGTALTEDFTTEEAVDTTCQCARDQHDYKQTGMIGKRFHCSSTGSYESIQCTGSVCYCSDKFGKRIGAHSVNVGLIDTLKC